MSVAAEGRLLVQACAAGDVEGVRKQLRLGASASASEPSGPTALHVAAAGGHLPVLRCLLQAGADTEGRLPVEDGGHTPLHWAVLHGRAAAAEELIDAGADVDTEELVSGKTPLILAGEAGLLSVAAALLAAGCDESRCDAEGYNAAFWAAAGGHRGFALLGGAPEPRKPTMEEMALHMGQTRMALVAVGAKLKAVPRAKKKAKGAKARR